MEQWSLTGKWRSMKHPYWLTSRHGGRLWHFQPQGHWLSQHGPYTKALQRARRFSDRELKRPGGNEVGTRAENPDFRVGTMISVHELPTGAVPVASRHPKGEREPGSRPGLPSFAYAETTIHVWHVGEATARSVRDRTNRPRRVVGRESHEASDCQRCCNRCRRRDFRAQRIDRGILGPGRSDFCDRPDGLPSAVHSARAAATGVLASYRFDKPSASAGLRCGWSGFVVYRVVVDGSRRRPVCADGGRGSNRRCVWCFRVVTATTGRAHNNARGLRPPSTPMRASRATR